MEKRTSSGKPVNIPPPQSYRKQPTAKHLQWSPEANSFRSFKAKINPLLSLYISHNLCRTYNDTLPLCQGRFKALNTRGAGSLFKLLQWTETSTKRSITSKPSFILIEIVIVLAILTMISSMAISVYVTNVPDVTGENTKSLGDFI